MSKARKPTLCAQCQGPLATKKPASRDVRWAYYRALEAAGARKCPDCKDYVMLETHQCVQYQAFRDSPTLALAAVMALGPGPVGPGPDDVVAP